MNHLHLKMLVIQAVLEECIASVVECLTPEAEVACSSLMGDAVLFS